MTTNLIPTTTARYHALTGRQATGQTQVATMTEYAGAVVTLTRRNDTYWSVIARDTRNAFQGTWAVRRGTSCAIWIDDATMEFVVDYWDGSINVEVDRTHTLRAAIGVACDSTTRRWAQAR
jgi:hypothetical protein